MLPSVSIVVVNYRTPKQTRLCLRALRRYTTLPCETIVVDNGSADESTEYLRSLSWIRLVEAAGSDASHGAGLDLGIRQATGDVIVVLHSDTFVRRAGWLESLLEHWGPETMVLASQDRVILPVTGLARLDAWRKRRKLERRWHGRGSPKIMTHCALFRRDLFTKHGQRFDHPRHIDDVIVDVGETIQRYCEHEGLEVHYLTREQLAPLLYHFEAATLNATRDRRLPWKRRWRTRRFYESAEIKTILNDNSLDS